MNKKLLISLLLVCVLATHAALAIRLPRIFSDNMVLQRDKPLKVWGWGKPGEAVTISFNGQKVQTKVAKGGTWSAMLKPMGHGGPYEMTVTAKSGNAVLKNVLVGDVWLGSGQSNMEWVLKNTSEATSEIPQANFAKIRLFTVEKDISFKPKDDLKSGEWRECTPSNAADFSAVAYYFGKTLHQQLEIPIGLINSSWGGTKVEPWISWDLMSLEPEFKDVDVTKFEGLAKDNEAKQAKYAEAMRNDKGMTEKWFLPETSPNEWKSVTLPQEWSNTAIGNTDGIVWFRKEFNLDQIPADSVTVSLGPIDDIDVTYVNGVRIGTESNWNKDRVYKAASSLFKKGTNVIVVKVQDDQGGGGIYGKPEQLYVESDGKKVKIDGAWLYRPSVLTSDFGLMDVGPNAFPSQLYNAMIAPVDDFRIRGVIWYQGESNTYAAFNYRRLFPMLIKNWREKWGYDFPFYWVQLANFMAPSEQPGESQWAELREAQRMALSLPNTGQAVIIDIGEADDIHPRNKKDVGRRLALNALAKEYGKDVTYSGPEFKAMEVRDGKAVLTFEHANGLNAKGNRYGYVQGFAIAGEDRKFVWARAFIEDGKVVVYSPEVARPVAVRYGWSDNPGDANLYNGAGLPASPFKTDAWPWTTEPKK